MLKRWSLLHPLKKRYKVWNILPRNISWHNNMLSDRLFQHLLQRQSKISLWSDVGFLTSVAKVSVSSFNGLFGFLSSIWRSLVQSLQFEFGSSKRLPLSFSWNILCLRGTLWIKTASSNLPSPARRETFDWHSRHLEIFLLTVYSRTLKPISSLLIVLMQHFGADRKLFAT